MDDNDYEWDDETVPARTDITPHSLAKGRRPCVLKQTQGPGAPQGFVLGIDRMILGRSTEADIRIDSNEISRRHLVLKKVGSEYSCTDLKSRNGIYLNGVKVHSAVLKDGDSLQIGNVVLVYREGA